MAHSSEGFDKEIIYNMNRITEERKWGPHVRLVFMCALEFASMKLNIPKIKILKKIILGDMRLNNVRNEYIKESIMIIEMSKEIKEVRARWHEKIMHRNKEHMIKEAIDIETPGHKRSKTPKY